MKAGCKEFFFFFFVTKESEAVEQLTQRVWSTFVRKKFQNQTG